MGRSRRSAAATIVARYFFLVAVALALTLVALLVAGGHVGAAQSDRGSAPFGATAAEGAQLYKQRCAVCHDNPGGRVPSRDAIGEKTPTFISSALTGGLMAEQARGLSQKQIASIAIFVSRNQDGGDVNSVSAAAPTCAAHPPPPVLGSHQWNGWGNDPRNSRFQPRPDLGPGDIAKLKVKWVVGLSGDRAGQPTVVDGRLFINDTSGAVYALDARTGCLYWRFNAAAGTRTTIMLGSIESGRQHHLALFFADRTRAVYALDAANGKMLWKTIVDEQVGAQMTGSPMFYDGKLYVPISSAEEYLATMPNYTCCKFRGALVALDAASGAILWKTYTEPTLPKPFKTNANGQQMFGPAGGAIWSSPTVDAKRKLIYVGTGNSYTQLPHAGADSIMAFDIESGEVRWKNQLTAHDNYVIGCFPGGRAGANCPEDVGGDYDFGPSPILHDLADGRQILVVGQKSSQVYGLDPNSQGKVLWTQRLSVGGPLGGVEFGPAADDQNVYVAISDIYMRGLAHPGLTALRIADGKILWTKPAPRNSCRWTNEYCNPGQSQAVSAMPGVVFSGSMDGHLRAYATADGAVLWDFNTAGQWYHTVTGRTVEGGVLDGGGPTIVKSTLYIVSGYAGRSGGGTALLAFSIDGK